MGLGRDSDHEGRNVDELLSDGDVLLSEKDSGVVDGGLGSNDSLLGHDGLESSLEELVDGETENVIELPLVVLEEAESDHSSDEGITYSNLISRRTSKL